MLTDAITGEEESKKIVLVIVVVLPAKSVAVTTIVLEPFRNVMDLLNSPLVTVALPTLAPFNLIATTGVPLVESLVVPATVNVGVAVYVPSSDGLVTFNVGAIVSVVKDNSVDVAVLPSLSFTLTLKVCLPSFKAV
jgi:hypothetical protein